MKRIHLILSLALITPLGFYAKFYAGPLQNWVNNSVSGVLYVIFWCLLLSWLWPRKERIVPICVGVFLFTSVLEIMQRWHAPILEWIRSSFIGRTLIGTTFAWSDFVYYWLGSIIGWLWLHRLARGEGKE